MKTLTEIRAIREQHAERILGLPHVTAVGIGYIGNRGKKQIGIIVYQDAPPAAPSQVPETIEGIPVEIREGRFSFPARGFHPQEESKKPPADIRPENLIGNPRDKEFEPMIGGVSVNPNFFYISSWQGTLGLAIRDKNGNPVILSNRHVICGKNPVAGDGVSQPSYEFFSHLAANLVAWNLGDVIYQGKKYGIDATIASPTNSRTATIGKTIDLDCYSNDSGTILSRQIIVENNIAGSYFAESGDSGSALIQTVTNNVVGLLWGGNQKTKEAMCSPIAPILDFFECTI